MKKSEITIRRSADQLTRRAIAELVQAACALQSTVIVRSSEFEVNAKSLLGMIALQIKPGMKLVITAKGADEELALSKICEWFS